MNWVIDIILIAILVVGFVMGYKRGFVKTVAKPVKLVAVWACTIKSCSFVGARFIAPLVQAPVTNKLAQFLQEKCQELTAANVSEELPTLLKMAAGLFDIDIDQVAANAGDALAQKLAETFTEPIVSVVSVVIAFVLLLLVFSVLFSVALWLLNAIFHMKPLAWFNRLLGVLFGSAFALIIAWLVSMVLGFIFNLPALSSVGFEGGAVYRFFREYHPLDLLLGF